MTEITHERCSELLGPYSTGRLDDASRGDVDSHLATCPDCSRELAGLTALRAGEVEPMTGPEREVITAAVRAAVLGGAKPITGPMTGRSFSAGWSEGWGRRLAPALGAAALVAIAVVGYVSFQAEESDLPTAGTATQDEDRSANTTVEDSTAEEAEAETFGASKEAGEPEADTAQSQDMQIEAGSGIDAPGRTAAAIAVVVEDRFARAAFTPDLFAPRDAALTTRNGGAGGVAATDTFLYAADDPALQSRVEECARTVTETSPYPLTPTYAAHFPDDDILVLGFVWRDEPSGALNFELRGWRGSSCDRVSPIYRSGPV
jgi:anti-sigma factor RsiW